MINNIFIFFFFPPSCPTKENFPIVERDDRCEDKSSESSLAKSARKPEKWSLVCEDDQHFDEKKLNSFSLNSKLVKSQEEEIFLVAKHLGLEDRWIRKERNKGRSRVEVVFNMLTQWRQINGRDATCGSLRKALQRTSDEIQR